MHTYKSRDSLHTSVAHIRVIQIEWVHIPEWSEWVRHLPVIATCVKGQSSPFSAEQEPVSEEEISEAIAREWTKVEYGQLSNSKMFPESGGWFLSQVLDTKQILGN